MERWIAEHYSKVGVAHVRLSKNKVKKLQSLENERSSTKWHHSFYIERLHKVSTTLTYNHVNSKMGGQNELEAQQLKRSDKIEVEEQQIQNLELACMPIFRV